MTLILVAGPAPRALADPEGEPAPDASGFPPPAEQGLPAADSGTAGDPTAPGEQPSVAQPTGEELAATGHQPAGDQPDQPVDWAWVDLALEHMRSDPDYFKDLAYSQLEAQLEELDRLAPRIPEGDPRAADVATFRNEVTAELHGRVAATMDPDEVVDEAPTRVEREAEAAQAEYLQSHLVALRTLAGGTVLDAAQAAQLEELTNEVQRLLGRPRLGNVETVDARLVDLSLELAEQQRAAGDPGTAGLGSLERQQTALQALLPAIDWQSARGQRVAELFTRVEVELSARSLLDLLADAPAPADLPALREQVMAELPATGSDQFQARAWTGTGVPAWVDSLLDLTARAVDDPAATWRRRRQRSSSRSRPRSLGRTSASASRT